MLIGELGRAWKNGAKITLLAADNFGTATVQSLAIVCVIYVTVRVCVYVFGLHLSLRPVISPARHWAESSHQRSLHRLHRLHWLLPPTPTRPENVNNMPEGSGGSFRESVAEEAMGDSQPLRDGNHNIVSVMAQLADQHLTVVRVGSRFFRPAADSVSSLC